MKINHFKIFIFQLRINSKLNMVRGVTPPVVSLDAWRWSL